MGGEGLIDGAKCSLGGQDGVEEGTRLGTVGVAEDGERVESTIHCEVSPSSTEPRGVAINPVSPEIVTSIGSSGTPSHPAFPGYKVIIKGKIPQQFSCLSASRRSPGYSTFQQ